MAELKPMEMIMRIDFTASNGIEVIAHAERVQELVRCKDCKWFNDYEVECSLSTGLVYSNSDDYCSKGERKEMDNED